MKTTKKIGKFFKPLFIVVIVFTFALGGLLGALTYVKADTGTREMVAASLSRYLDKNPDSVIATSLADYLGVSENIGATTVQNQSNESPFHRITLLYDNSLTGVTKFVAYGNVTIATSTDYLDVSDIAAIAKNQEVFINWGQICLSGTVSSTVNFGMGSSTINSLAWNTSSEPSGLIDDTQFVTSTTQVAYTTGYRNCRNSIKDAGTLGENEIRLTTTTPYFTIFRHKGDTCPSGACEAVTSTNGGYSGVWRVEGYYLKDF